MPYTVTAFESTPNPNAVKCVLDKVVSATSRSFRERPDPGQPIDDPLAKVLFEIPGVAGLLLCNDWITVRKAPEAPWPAIKSALKAALAKAP